jgi:hypothetical protein
MPPKRKEAASEASRCNAYRFYLNREGLQHTEERWQAWCAEWHRRDAMRVQILAALDGMSNPIGNA